MPFNCPSHLVSNILYFYSVSDFSQIKFPATAHVTGESIHITRITNQPTNYMEQSPSCKASSHSSSQDIIPYLLQNLKVQYYVQKSPPLFPILSQMHPLHIFPNYSLKIHSNIIFPPVPRSSELSLLFRWSNQNTVWISHLFHGCYILHPSNP